MFLSIKNIPKVYWSSEKPFNLKPKISTFFFLIIGLALFGLGEGLLIVSAMGNSPWTVLAEGIHLDVGFSIVFNNYIYKYSGFTFLAAIKTKAWNWNNSKCLNYWFND